MINRIIYLALSLVLIINTLSFAQKPEDYINQEKFLKKKTVSSGNRYVDTKFETKVENKIVRLYWQEPYDYYNHENIANPIKFVNQSSDYVLRCISDPILEENEFDGFDLYIDGQKFKKEKPGGEKTLGVVPVRETQSGSISVRKVRKSSLDTTINLKEGTHGYKIGLKLKGKEKPVFTKEIFIDYQKVVSKLFVFTIGVPHGNLRYTQKDALDFGRVFSQNSGKIFSPPKVIPFTTIDSTGVLSLRRAFENIGNYKFGISKNDVIIIYISTHGVTHQKKYILPCYDFISGNEKTYSLDFESDILAQLSNIDCKKIIFLDACKSGQQSLLAVKGDDFQDVQMAINSSMNKAYLFASSRGSQASYEDDTWENGVFTEAIIKGLELGEADTKTIRKTYKSNSMEVEDVRIIDEPDGKIWLSELKAYLETEVPKLMGQVSRFKEANITQNPTIADIDPKNDYPIYEYVVKKKQ